MSKDFNSYGIKLTELQIERQINKLRNVFFQEYEELEDGSYKGEVVVELIEIINTHVENSAEMTQSEFLICVKECANKIFEWIQDKVTGVDERLMALYCFDFANQTLNGMFSINFGDRDDNDSMYA